ncbi:AMP-binding protein [Phytohalomonas tamaricis]|uniref:AMP-binding protein n=1 Tax=Phytohalomonas tamaricis TaxID=2081032 RepID=UPI0021D3FEBC|nr:AMP-binding protein [Phytohalomonas tamaricis]
MNAPSASDVELLNAPWRSQDPSRIVAYAPDRACTLKALHARIAAWQTVPCNPEQPIALFEPNPWEFTCALLACWHLGYRLWLPGDNRPETVERLTAKGALLIGTLPGGWRPLDNAPQSVRWGELNQDAIAVELFTSGSSGAPTRIAKTFAQLASETDVLARTWPLAEGVVISQVSHQHIYGLTSAILRALCEQRPFSLATCSYPETLAQYLEAMPVSALISSPAQLERLPTTLGATSYRIAQIYSSGAPLAKSSAEHAEHLLKASVIELYGSSETGGIGWRRQHQASDWTVLDDVEIKVVDDLLQLRSPRLAQPTQWLMHADRVALHDSHHFTLLGRADRIAKIGGKRVSLEGLARHLEHQPNVLRAHCVEIDHSGGRIGALVQLDAAQLPHDHATRRALIMALRDHLGQAFEPVVLPRFWRFVEDWPVNAQGKLTQMTIARLFADLDDRKRPRWLGERFNTPEQVTITLEIPERLAQLNGHFPARPIVPGVVIVQWASALATELFGCDAWHTLERIKFPLPLVPGERTIMTLIRSSATRIDFKLESRHGIHASGRGLHNSLPLPQATMPRGGNAHV